MPSLTSGEDRAARIAAVRSLSVVGKDLTRMPLSIEILSSQHAMQVLNVGGHLKPPEFEQPGGMECVGPG